MSCRGIAVSLYHVAAGLHAQRVIWDHSLGKSPEPLMIQSMTWQYKLYKKTILDTESDDKGPILPIYHLAVKKFPVASVVGRHD